MASFTTQADAIRSAVTSIQTCTPTISATLKELLLGADAQGDLTKPPPKPKTTRTTKPKTTTTTKRAPPAKAQSPQQDGPDASGLSSKEKALLATQVINATLKTLGEAAKNPSPRTVAQTCADGKPVKSTARARPRRSNSVPMTPLQPRTLNRVSTTPMTAKITRTPAISAASSGCLATVECARAAFTALRTLSNAGKTALPELQLESGMSSFISKLIALNLYEHALKELRLLKRRLEAMASGAAGKKSKPATTAEPASAAKTFSDLFDYPAVGVGGPVLALIISSQLQALRILYGLKKSSHLDTALPFLLASSPSSPSSLLLLSSKDEKPDRVKCARQLENLAQSLLSLTPSVASRDDAIAMEPRLSPSPETTIQIQSLALVTRLQSWGLSGHKGNVDNDILLPLSKCLSACSRRSVLEPLAKFDNISHAFKQISSMIETVGARPSESSKSPLAAIYQVLGTASRDAGNFKEALVCMKKLKAVTTPQEDSPARCCSVTAQLIALSLKQSPSCVSETLLIEVLEGLQGSLSGSSTELDDLLISVCLVRKAAIHLVLSDTQLGKESAAIRDNLESIILQLPRFASRWLGKPPAADSSTKDLLRFEQRRQLLSKYITPIIDSALMLVKFLLDRSKITWEVMDPILQDSLVVLEHMGDLALLSIKNNAAASYHVKISHFYYQQHVALRQNPKVKDSQSLLALRRSIEAVKQRSEAEQVKAQLLAKQERLVELCRTSGRRDDATDTLRSIRDTLVREDVITQVTAALSSQSVLQAWMSADKVASLSKTVCNLAKLDQNPCDWTWLLTGSEKATALEHDLYFIYSRDARSRRQLKPGDAYVGKLLGAFDAHTYPIRQLRTLVQLISVNLDSPENVFQWQEQAVALSASIDVEMLAQDSGLAHFLPHLQALTTCITALVNGELEVSTIQKALNMWNSVLEQSHTTDDIYKYIDNPAQLVTILQGLADFARMRGCNGLLGSILSVSAAVSRKSGDDNPELFLSQNTALCLQHLTLGHSNKAEEVLVATLKFLGQQAVSPEATANLHLCSAEFQMAIGNFDLAEKCLADAYTAATSPASDRFPKSSRLAKKLSLAYASFLHSMLALERGQSHHALQQAKHAVRILFHDWVKLETLRGAALEHNDEVSQTELMEVDSSFNSSQCSQAESNRANTGPEFWAMVYPLFRFVMRLSSVYAHVGMYQETIYYAEQAQKIAVSTGSLGHVSQSQHWLASVLMTAGKPEQALELAAKVKAALLEIEPTYSAIEMTCQLSRIYRDASDYDTELHLMNMAESMLQKLSATNAEVVPLEVVAQMEKLTIKEKPATKATVRQIKPRTATATRKAAVKKIGATRAKIPAESKVLVAAEDTQLAFLRASILHQKSVASLDSKDWSAAVTSLQTAYELSKLSTDVTQERLLMAIALVGQSLEQMGKDSVFSVIQDSTLSFPAIASSPKDKSDRQPSVKATPPRKTRPAADPSFLSNLQQAQDYLLEAHSIASLNGNARLVYRIAALLQNVFILLSTTCPTRSSGIGHPAHATCSIELARNLVWRRERKTLRLDLDKSEKAEWPVLMQAADPRRSSLGFSVDMNRFQREYVDIIPKSWNVVSISLSDNKHDLCITKLQADHSPFAIRLPLERASSRDADSEVFDFLQGRTEMVDIIQVANRTCHDARDMSQKGAKSAWWAEREALDERMKDLLENVEQTWLGGFRGIFAQHHRRSDLLARFQKSFHNVLDKHLPSRQQVRGKRSKTASTTKVSLDPRILDLFIGLGDATIPDCDLDEPLTDLLYFVVDILQFHGERNAYDEIDFDSMVVETFDALHSYHAAVKGTSQGDENVHTILVLDKALHIFPWESLPCMQGVAVSRIPSLACLRRSILEQRASPVQHFEAGEDGEMHSSASNNGHHISLHSGTYILNPGADLKSTEATFAKPLAALPPTWSTIETRVPTESEFEKSLTHSDLLLYFGHGSGAQYIRGRTIRKMEKCRAVALLMGCSSASLADVGDFESHGPVWNYMLAGSPAVVGTLWDVTDRDIDRYAGKVFEEWGLMPKGTFAEDGPNESDEMRSGAKTSLVQAVAKARDACRFRYLTAAAVVVYGIPVYISK
ncbi:peptidase family C50-domain-containing protein [Truncatella angustata]|uniref:separase n=1 Tax=Truncatella angustata TaxID=152316 RepID=A0A9P8UMB3_9PEZI|nr:peptidase family C50-domain-containing protein [Truncatella angustata]KAH6654585.1 peptidase family C50-domain-containing protein [Truncatella angustata]